MSAAWVDEYVTMCDDCLKRHKFLTQWEEGFLNSIKSCLTSGTIPTARQLETLDRTWDKITSKGCT